jgi:dienelactone hydrolase
VLFRRIAALVALAIVAPHPVASAAAVSVPTGYQALSPVRVLDTRQGNRTTPNVPVKLRIANGPEGAAALVLNVTVTSSQSAGYASVYPCGDEVPITSNVNFLADQTIANLVMVRPGVDGLVCLLTDNPAHLIADLQGWFPADAYTPDPAPKRIVDTRVKNALVPAGREVVIVNDSSADAAEVINVTVTEPQASGWLTVYPCGTSRPFTSNVNFVAGRDAANLVIARAGETSAGWQVCAAATATTHIVVDHQGRINAPAGYRAITPVRMFDSRQPIGQSTATRLVAGKTVEVSFPIVSGMPAAATTASLNVTATDATSNGFLTVYPCGGSAPTASNVNVVVGQTVPNAVVTKLGPRGTVCVYASAPMHVVIDLQGWFDGATATLGVPITPPAWERHDAGVGTRLGYMAYLPPGYASNPGRTWPTIVFLHGSGEAGAGTGADLARMLDVGLPQLLRDKQAPSQATGFIVLVPQIPDSRHDPARLRTWLTQALSQFAVDRDRLYLTGLSLGGYGVFDYLGAYGDSNEFAAMAPIAGDLSSTVSCRAWEHTPLWAFHGELDQIVDPAGAIDTINTVNTRCKPSERLRFTLYGDVGHNSYDQTYDLRGMTPGWALPEFDPYDVDLYTWLLSHTRSLYR